ELAKAITDLGSDLRHPHPRLHHQFTAQPLTLLRALTIVECDAAVLALLVPAEASIGDVLRRQELEAAQHHVVLGDFDLFPHDGDLDQILIRAEQRAGRRAHVCASFYPRSICLQFCISAALWTFWYKGAAMDAKRRDSDIGKGAFEGEHPGEQ